MQIPKDQFTSLSAVRKRLEEVTLIGNTRFRRWNSRQELARPAVGGSRQVSFATLL